MIVKYESTPSLHNFQKKGLRSCFKTIAIIHVKKLQLAKKVLQKQFVKTQKYGSKGNVKKG